MEVMMDPRQKVPVKMWTDGVEVEYQAREQLIKTASMPFIFKHVAVMPDVHLGIGATVGSVIPTKGAIIPAAVGVDIGCGMMALRTTLEAKDLPDNLDSVRSKIEEMIPVGQAAYKEPPKEGGPTANELILDFRARVVAKHGVEFRNALQQLGTLGGGNHFIEVCLDGEQQVWVMLHSGSRGIGNRIGTKFIELAKEDMRRHFINLPDQNLAYVSEGTELFDDYVAAVGWAQDYAMVNRRIMLDRVMIAMRDALGRSVVHRLEEPIVACHHNYIEQEEHFGERVWVTRKGAVRAREGDLGIIPGSMGTRSYIVRGKGHRDSFTSCSHGAGRRMSRGEAKQRITLDDHLRATEGVACRKDAGVLDESPAAYKDIDHVIAAQADLVEVLHTLKAIVCVKG